MSYVPTQDGAPRKRRRNNHRNSSRGSYNRSGNFRRQAPKQTAFEKVLSFLTFGLLGKPGKKKTANRKPTSRVTVVKRSENPTSDRPKRTRRESQPADPASVNIDRLYVGNLSYDATESDLFELFNGVGAVRNAEVVVNNRTQRSKGFAFVTMANVEEARRAVAELHGKDFMGRPLQLSAAKPAAYGPREDEPGDDEDSPSDSFDDEEQAA